MEHHKQFAGSQWQDACSMRYACEHSISAAVPIMTINATIFAFHVMTLPSVCFELKMDGWPCPWAPNLAYMLYHSQRANVHGRYVERDE